LIKAPIGALPSETTPAEPEAVEHTQDANLRLEPVACIREAKATHASHLKAVARLRGERVILNPFSMLPFLAIWNSIGLTGLKTIFADCEDWRTAPSYPF
jgi:hypothetical protein